MKRGIATVGRAVVGAGAWTAVLWSSATLAASPDAARAAGGATSAASAKQPTNEEHEVWRKKLLRTPRPRSGCFTATYPEGAWRQVPCKPSRPHPLSIPPRGGMSQIDTVGGGGPTDFSATVTGHISQAEGSFDSVTGVTSSGGYSLQVNSAPFSTSTCSTSPAPAGCQGWEQFVYQSSGSAYIQYWLLTYGPSGTLCPTPRHAACAAGVSYSDGWCPFQFSSTGSVYCVINAVNEPTAPAESMTSLGLLRLAGEASAGSDSITVTASGTPASATGNDYFPDFNNQWQEVEFNVFGTGSGSAATFNSGANVVVRTEVISGTTAGPGCHLQSWTGETNNLTLVNSAPASPASLPAPALVFSESDPAASGAAATCADAASLGDTHLTTFNGLLYDFQAAGDFTLAEVAPGFEVQTRQVSGAPLWPNAAVNKAVAARFGKTQVAVCPASPGTDQTARIFVDGKLTPAQDGKTLLFPEGGGLRRRGNVYTLLGRDGDSVRATVNSYGGTSWIDVKVGLGRWPSTVKGLIANANGNVNQLATRDNAGLTAPFDFDDLYHRFADSWRVADATSMLSVCNGERPIERGIPEIPFYATALAPDVREKARVVCDAAGVKAGPLLDACTLDVAVIGQNAAATVFAGAPQPVAVGTIVGKHEGGGVRKILPWLLLLLGLIIVVFLLIRRGKGP